MTKINKFEIDIISKDGTVISWGFNSLDDIKQILGLELFDGDFKKITIIPLSTPPPP